MNPSPAFSNHDLLEACQQTGCPVCRVGAQSVKRYLKSIFYEYVNDIKIRDQLNKRLGLCAEHIQLLLNTRIADALGASIIYENILKVVLREFPNAPSNPKEAARWLHGLMDRAEKNGTCLACEQRGTVMNHALDEMGRAISDESLQSALRKSDGLCLPHMAQLLERVEKPVHVTFLLDLARQMLEKRQGEMAEVIRKNDYRSSSEKISQEEAIAWRKSMSMVSGVSISLPGDKHE